MTLCTRVAVILPETNRPTPEAILEKLILALCLAADNATEWGVCHMPELNQYKGYRYRDEEKHRALGTKIGQGFHAITDVTYSIDGDYRTPENVEHDRENPDEDGWYDETPACTYLLSMDTAYGARYNNGPVTSAWTLHLAAIYLLNKWVQTHGGSLQFQDESTGKWFAGDDPEGFDSVTNSGAGASNWFENIVKPVISAEATAEGQEIVWN